MLSIKCFLLRKNYTIIRSIQLQQMCRIYFISMGVLNFMQSGFETWNNKKSGWATLILQNFPQRSWKISPLPQLCTCYGMLTSLDLQVMQRIQVNRCLTKIFKFTRLLYNHIAGGQCNKYQQVFLRSFDMTLDWAMEQKKKIYTLVFL